jgi:hypothetical protein
VLVRVTKEEVKKKVDSNGSKMLVVKVRKVCKGVKGL